MEYEEETSWSRIYKTFPDIKRNEIRKIYTREKRKHEVVEQPPELPSYLTKGDTVSEEEFDEEELWKQARAIARRRKEKNDRKHDKEIIFDHAPICLVWMADLHLGDSGLDYERLDRDLKIIMHTPGMYVALVGDMLNNYIVGRLKDIRFGTELTITQEWILVRRVLRLLAPKLLLSVAGNHDLWTYSLTNIDFLKEVHARMNPDILYAKYDNRVKIRIGDKAHAIRARHKWKGYSQYNPTHGIELASKFDKGRHFDIGVGAHTHAAGVYRQFNNGGKTGHAVLCGSYVSDDEFPEMLGLPEPNESAAVATIFGKYAISGTNCLQEAAYIMNAIYQPSSDDPSLPDKA